MTVTRRQAALDVLVISALALLYVVAAEGGVLIRYIIPAVAAALLAHLFFVLRRRGETWRELGLRADNLIQAGWRAALFTLAGAALVAACAWRDGVPLWRPELAVLLPLYPLWGIAQQLIFQGIFHRRWIVLTGEPRAALFLTAAAFAAVHAGDARLVALTFAAGLAWSWLFQRWPNVWVLGVSHGILAAMAYPLLLGRNPLEGV